jgi:GH25 family lysozyme M1 (1,4-beta-N-acetylmuramidase)
VRDRYAVWIAHYGVSKPSYSGSYGMWQYASDGKVNGIAGNIDMDYCYIDYPKAIKEAGKNGFKKEEPKPVEPKPEPEPETKPEEPQLKTIDVEVVVDGIKYGGTLTEKE